MHVDPEYFNLNYHSYTLSMIRPLILRSQTTATLAVNKEKF